MVIRNKLTSAMSWVLLIVSAPSCVSGGSDKYDVKTSVSSSGPSIGTKHRFALVSSGGREFMILGSQDPDGPLIGVALVTRNGQNQSEFLATDSARLGEKVYTVISERFSGSEMTNSRRLSWTGVLQRGHGSAVPEPLVSEVQVQIVRFLLSRDSFPKDSGCRLFVFGTSQALFGLEFTDTGLERILQITVTEGITTKWQMEKLTAGSCISYDAPFGSLSVGSLYRGHLSLRGKKAQISWRVTDNLTQL